MAAGEGPAIYESRFADATTLAAKQYYCLKRSTVKNEVLITSATTSVAVGILQNNPAATQAATICVYGRTKAVVDGNSVNIAIGDPLGPSANGRLVKVTADKAIFCAWAEEAATADAVTIEVTFVGNQYYAA